MAQLKDSVVTGNIRVTNNTLVKTLQTNIVNAPTASGGTTYGPGTNGQVLKSNGTSVYWGPDNDTTSFVPSSQGTANAGKFLTVNASGQVVCSNFSDMVTTRTSADLTVSGATVTAPAGYYASNASKAVANGTVVASVSSNTGGSANMSASGFTASSSATSHYVTLTTVEGSVKAKATGGTAGYVTSSTTNETSAIYVSVSGNGNKLYIPEGSATTPATSVTANPTIAVSATGLISASVSATKSVTPTVTEGYISTGTSGDITVSGSKTLQLSIKSAQTYTPGTSNQTIASGLYTTGVQTILGDSDLVASNIKKSVQIFGVTGTFTTTPSGKTAMTAASLRSGYAGFINGSQVNGSMPDTTVTEGTTTVDGETATRGTWSQTAGYTSARTISTATFANEATSEQTYVDISNTTSAPVLATGDYLYINKGWTDNLKISLAKLVPDGSDVKGHGDYILLGHSAYDNDGTLVAGTIPTLVASDVTVSGKTVTIPTGKYTGGTAIQKSVADGAYSASVSSHSVTTTPVVTGSISGTVTSIGTTTKPSGTDGTNYWTITPSGSVTTTGVSTAKGKATIGTAGYLATGNKESTASTVNITPTVSNGTARYIVKGAITNNTSGGTSTATINRGSQIKIGTGYYPSDLYYTAQSNSGTLTITTSHNSSTNVSCDGQANVQVTGITVKKDGAFSLITTADTALDTTSNITITNNAYRRVVLTNNANGTVEETNYGSDSTINYGSLVVSHAGVNKQGTTSVVAYNTASDTSTASSQVVVQSGVWKTTNVSASGTYYGRVVISTGAYSASVSSHSVTTTPVVTGSISGTVTNIGTTTKPSGTDGTNYWTITPSGSVTTTGVSTAKGKATIGTAGYLATGNKESTASTVNITPTVSNGTARYIVKGAITNNTSGGTSTATINRGSQIKIGAGYYPSDLYYTAQGNNSGTLTITTSDYSSTNIDCNGYENVQVNGITVAKDKEFVLMSADDTALDETSDIYAFVGAYRILKVGTGSNSYVNIGNSGITKFESNNDTSGSLLVQAFGSSDTREEATIVSAGKWVTTSASASGTYYGKVTVGAGSYNASVSSHSITTTPVVTGSISGTVTSIGTTTKPSGTDGTNYWTITPSGSVTTTGVSTAKGKATIGTAGYLATGNKESSANTVNITPTVSNGSARYIVKGAITNNTSGGTSTATINRGKQIKIGTGYYPSDLYYTAQANSGTKSITSFGTSISCDGYQYVSVPSASTSISGGELSGNATVNTTSGCAVNPSANNSGVSFTVGASATRAIVNCTASSYGWVNSGTIKSLNSTTVPLTTKTYYIDGVTMSKPSSGNRIFSVTSPDANNVNHTYLFTVDAEGHTTIKVDNTLTMQWNETKQAMDFIYT